MKMRKKLAALLAAAMIASVMPMTAFAASTNRVDKNGVTVKKGDSLNESSAPNLVIDLKDRLTDGKAFYLELENAEWKEEDADFKWTTFTTTGGSVTLKRLGDKLLEVKASDDFKEEFMVPLFVKATGGEATVTIDPSGTVVSYGKYVFAVSDDSKAKVEIEDAKTFVDQAKIATIKFTEAYQGHFNDKDESQEVVIELDDSDFYFATKGKLVGKKGLDTKDYPGEFGKDQESVIFTIPANGLKELQKGYFEIEGLEIKARRGASEGDVTAYVRAPFVDNASVTLAKFGDYSTGLTTEKVEEFTAGSKKTVKFTLEQVGAAIVESRGAIFTFSKDIEIVEIKKAGKDADKAEILKDKNEFEIPVFTGIIDDNKVEFEVEINIPSKFTGDILVSADGRALDGTSEVKLAEVKAPVTVEVEAMSIKAGTRENKGGKITITETDKQNINRGTLVIQLPKDLKDDGVEFENVKDLVIETTGGIKANEAKYNSTTSAIEIEITRQSTEVGSIEVSGFEVKAKRAIIDGAYEVEIGGKAISEIADLAVNDDKDGYKKIDAITSADFLLVGNVYARAEVVFTIGSEKFTVNGKEVTMDAQAFIQDGRTMVPLRYLSYALGIDTESIKFNSGIVTIFAEDGRVIQVKNGDKNLAINGMTIPMAAAATIVEGRTYVPVTEIGGVFGVTGTWDSEAQTATFK